MARKPESSEPAAFRLQGTDGIRREVKSASDPELRGLSPQEAFLQKGFITEEFMELYAFAHVKESIARGEAKPGQGIVVGWDPRDPQGRFTGAVVRGIRKAGARALVIGVAPTPLVPMYMLYKNAGGGFMVTASHNPRDQNGIKTFLAFRGMKPLPAYDETLTRSLLATNFQTVKKARLQGKRLDCREEARVLLRRFSLDPENAWTEPVAGHPLSFKNVILIVDPANGSLSGIAADIFRLAGFGRVIEVNARNDGNVNRLSGVADLEGHTLISPSMIHRNTGLFRKHRAVLKLFELGRKQRAALLKGDRRVAGAVFDGDGDRFYRLEYDPFNDSLLVLSGDETAFLQARYLVTWNPRRYRNAAYINTVESDLNTARAVRKLGLKPVLTAVGDKWILQRIAALDSFAIGSEETGHTITLGRLRLNKGGYLPVFCGNGLKSALNTFAATEFLLHGKSARTYFSCLRRPFPPGFKHTLYAYYVRKEEFHRDSAVWRRLKRRIYQESRELGYRPATVRFPEDPDMLYISLKTGSGSEERSAAVFIRNSGTENKIGVNLRGDRKDARNLKAMGENIIRLLLAVLKDPDNRFYKLELDVLSQVAGQSLPESRLILNRDSRNRLLTEIKKQGLIRLTPKGYRLTPRGKWYITSGGP